MYTISEFSRMTGLTVKTLRFYHEKGLVVPSYIAADTGYRYYNTHDLEVAQAVCTLKAMSCSLAEISELMAQYSEDSDLLEFLQAKKQALALERARLKQVTSAIDNAIQFANEAKTMSVNSTEIIIKELPATTVISERWQGSYAQTGKVLGKLYRAAGRHAAGPSFNLYYDGEYKEQDADIETCLPVKEKYKKATTKISGGRYISLIHKGPYETLHRSYARLMSHAKDEKLTLAQAPARELYLKGPGMIFKGKTENYLTEIYLPLEG